MTASTPSDRPAPAERPEDTVARIFHVTLVLKLLGSAVEIGGGLLLLFVPTSAMLAAVKAVTGHDLLDDPDNVVGAFILRSIEALGAGHHTGAALYLLSHGAIKLFLVVMVLRDRMWAYPVFLAVLAIFIVYQGYQIALGGSVWLIALTALDIVVFILTFIEWRRRSLRLARRLPT
ncbi:MAG: DUF2127 domain-containing protein [Bauldia sp.]